MEKSADAFRTISEVADDLDLPQHVLRFWETRFPHIRPLKRAGGRRYYRPADVTLLRTIRQLLYDEGYTIKGVQRLLKEQGARSIRAGAAATPLDLSGADLARMTSDGSAAAEARPEPGSDQGRSAPNHAASTMSRLLVEDHDALLDTLTIVDECARILEALRRPRT